MEIKFKNGSYIKTIESNESRRAPNVIKFMRSDPGPDSLSSFLAMDEDDRTIYFLEHYMGVKLNPLQTMCIRMISKLKEKKDMEKEKNNLETEQVNNSGETFTFVADCEMGIPEFNKKRNDAMFSYLDMLTNMIALGNSMVHSLETALADGKTIGVDGAHGFATIINTITDVAKYTFEDDD